ncbi:MAG TPA: alpha/beta fold hydrolase [Candidatus Dormibacteraeota bacterium]|jgi:2-succinyl-6-hydroxy-2,4-cyclohexadiene-1-carboxylate synthase|nr:alpha/beta fold hydrolase [Candidatus Dormibacteraeota bacterium]
MLHHLLRGRGDMVTLLHGFTQRGASWDEVVSLLPSRWSFLTPDLPGHGQSGDEGATMEETAAALVDLWDRLGVARTHLAGYSLGGRLALYTAALHPDRIRSLVTIGAHAGFTGEVRTRRAEEDRRLAEEIERRGVEWFAEDWGRRPLFAGLARRGPAYLEDVRARRGANRASGLAASLRGMGGGATEPFWNRLDRISAPTLLVAGAEDERYVAMAGRLAEHIPGAGTAIVPDSSHVVHMEQPGAFAQLLARHLQDHA